MTANACMVIDFGVEKAARLHLSPVTPPHISIDDSIRRITRCDAWLIANGIANRGFVFSTLSRPVIYVWDQREVRALFSGRIHSKGHVMHGNSRIDAFEGFDEHNHVDVRWEEVSQCA
ncbi:hypothetical protein [Propionivibrio sp.]|uniref:hypothetical protein n=1 Tax=Propionivibrio sp. TaxID=2212460 RepID=UPI003BEFBAA2